MFVDNWDTRCNHVQYVLVKHVFLETLKTRTTIICQRN